MCAFFSVVVPTYNSQERIGHLLHSLKKQEFIDFNVWFADDGSTDDTPLLLRSACDSDPRYHLLQLSHNGTASRGRNCAIHHADGQYIIFADSDDWFDECAFANIHQELCRLDMPEVLSVHFTIIDEQGNVIGKRGNLPRTEKNLSGTAALLLGGQAITGYSFGSICRRDFLLQNELWQASDIFMLEDLEWTLRVYCHCERMGGSEISVYYYLQHADNATLCYSSKTLFDVANALTRMSDFLKMKQDIPPATRKMIANLICSRGWMFFFYPSSVARSGKERNEAFRRWHHIRRLFPHLSPVKKALIPLTVVSRIPYLMPLGDLFFQRIYYPFCGRNRN